jgi:hypothetical protein
MIGALALLAALQQPMAPAAPAPPTQSVIKAIGSLSAMGQLHDRDGAGTAARPAQTGRVTANLTLDFANGLFVVPLTALISTDQVSFRQQINQLGVSPRYGPVTLRAGHFAPSFSSYTLSDQTLLGGGIEAHPGHLRASLVGGRSQKGITPDTTGTGGGPALGTPQFERWAYAARLGYGDPERSFVDVIAMRAEEDETSVDSVFAQALTAQENTVFGLKGRLSVGALAIDVEAGHSTYEHDKHAPTDDTKGDAASVGLRYRLGDWTVGGTVENVTTGFRTLGNAAFVSDRRDYTLTLGGRAAGGRVVFNATGGWRENNLSHALDATTEQTLYNVSATLQPSALFGLDLQAANNVNHSKAPDDTSSIKNVTGQLSVMPRLQWRTGAAQHALMVMFNQQQSENTSPASVGLIDATTRTVIGIWSLTFPSSLSFNATATHTAVELDTFPRTTITTVGPGVSFAAFRGKLQLALQAQFTHAKTGAGSDDDVFPQVQIRYTVARGQSLQLRSSQRHHDLAAGGSFDERIVSLQYSATWR